MKTIFNSNKGQALITLLIFVIISVIITSAAVIIIAINTRGAFELEQGTLVYYIAESGAENALLRLLRNPSYTGEVLTVGDGTATILVTVTDPKTITVTGTVGNFSRKVQVVAGYTDNILTVNSWKEVP